MRPKFRSSSGNYLSMLPYGGKHCKASVKSPEGKDLIDIIDSDENDRNLNAVGWSATTQEMNSSWNTTDTRGRKSPVRLFGELGDKVESMVGRIGADINRALVTKQQRMETSSESVKISEQKIKQISEMQDQFSELLRSHVSLFQNAWIIIGLCKQARIDRQIQNTRKDEQFAEFLKMFESYEDVRITENNATKYSAFQELESRAERDREVTQQNNTVEQSRIMQMKRVQTIIFTHEKYLKDLAAMEKNNDDLLTGVQNKLKKDMNKLKRKLLRETQCQELETVHQALQNMFS